MRINNNSYQCLGGWRNLAIAGLFMALGLITPGHADSLYVGDVSDNTVKSFDAATGEYLGVTVKQSLSGLHGPRGLLIEGGRKPACV